MGEDRAAICGICGSRGYQAHAPHCFYVRPQPNPAGGDATDPVNHPRHYTSHPSGVECIQVTEHMGFNLGNAVKYIWRADLKNDAMEDLRKAAWYVQREIERREKAASTPVT